MTFYSLSLSLSLSLGNNPFLFLFPFGTLRLLYHKKERVRWGVWITRKNKVIKSKIHKTLAKK